MQSADDVDFGSAGIARLAGGLDDLLDRHLVRPVFATLAVERAELAAQGADVGVIDVAVAIEVDPVAVVPLADEVGQSSDRMNIEALVQGYTVVQVQLDGIEHLARDALELRILDFVRRGHWGNDSFAPSIKTSETWV